MKRRAALCVIFARSGFSTNEINNLKIKLFFDGE